MAEGTLKIDNKVFYRTVATLVVPLALQNLINVAVQSADVVMLGMVDELVLSAASLAGQVQFVMMLIIFGLSSGAVVLTAQYWGKGDRRTIEKVMSIALRLSMLVAVLFFMAAQLIPEMLMRIFTPEAAVIELGVRYLRVVSPGYLVVGFTNIYLNIMRSTERVNISTAVYLVSLVANIIFNSVLIFGLLGFPAMGIVGAGLATSLARMLELCIVGVYAARNKELRLRAKDFVRLPRALMADFIRYALPTTLNEMLWGMAISANAVIIGHLGAAVVAANSVANVTRQLATVVSFGVASAAAIMIGKALGAGEVRRAEAYGGKLMRLSVITGTAGCAVVLLLRPLIVHVMELSPEAKDYLSFQLLVLSLYVIGQAITATLVVGLARAGGDTRFGLVLDVCAMWGCSLVWASLAAFVFHWPIKVVLVLIMMEEFIKVPICIWRYRKKYWLRNVTRPTVEEEPT